MRFRVQHAIIVVWLFFWLFVVAWRVQWWLGLTFVALFVPLYWQVYITLKEDIHDARERALIPREPTQEQTADDQGDKLERAEE